MLIVAWGKIQLAQLHITRKKKAPNKGCKTRISYPVRYRERYSSQTEQGKTIFPARRTQDQVNMIIKIRETRKILMPRD
jgi:hypothetical protein